MATSTSSSRTRISLRGKAVSRTLSRARIACRSIHPGWVLSFILIFYIIISTFFRSSFHPFDPSLPDRQQDVDQVPAQGVPVGAAPGGGRAASTLKGWTSSGDDDDDLMQRRLQSAHASNFSSTAAAFKGTLGNHFCIMQPTLSAGKTTWREKDARNHIAIRAFMRTFADTVTPAEREKFRFSIYYGYDSDDPVFGDNSLRRAFADAGRKMLSAAGFTDDDVKFVFTPAYGLHGRLNAIWNMLAKDAYYDGCDYFFLSNDDMIFFTRGWVSHSVDSLNGIGAPKKHKRPCRGFGIVRFKDEWASWATFTFHVSTRMHLEIFGGTYYPVPYHSAHNDYWINFVYRSLDASKYRGEVRVRNRVDDVDFALAHQKDTQHVAPPRYTYDKRGHATLYIKEGVIRAKAWLKKYRNTERCPPPL